MNPSPEPDDESSWRPPAWQVQWEDSVESTMDRARAAARGGAPSGSVIAAREQTGGRGRSGRSWSSPKGGLYASVLIRGPPRKIAPLLPLAGALAVRDGLAALVPALTLQVKWPNDVLAAVGDREGKFAGILTEAAAVGEKMEWVVVGFGVNVGVEDNALPQDVDPPAVGLPGLGVPVPSLGDALDAVLNAFSRILEKHAQHPDRLVEAVEQVLAMRGREVKGARRGGQGDVLGVLRGIDPSGDAVLETEVGEERLTAWDLERLRLA